MKSLAALVVCTPLLFTGASTAAGLAGSSIPGTLAGTSSPEALSGAPNPEALARGSVQKPRARDLGIPFEGTPGPLNGITDVAGVEVGHATLISGSGALRVGGGPVRTGVTAVFPRGKESLDGVFAGWFSLNGDGEMTGTTWVEDSGFLHGPVMITNTLSVGAVDDALIAWYAERAKARGDSAPFYAVTLPVVAETWDGYLNDIWGQHVRREHVFAAIEAASDGPVQEGNVGGGTGMICHQFKGGIGTSSRRVSIESATYTVGVLVQCNYGSRSDLRIAGVPVGQEIPVSPDENGFLGARVGSPGAGPSAGWLVAREPDREGSIIIVVATDAPLLAHQLKRVVRRAALGLARNGSISSNGSGDIFIAFSTANAGASRGSGNAAITMMRNGRLTSLFRATVHATEEAVINAMVAAETMTGANDRTVEAIPHDRLREVMREYNRLGEPTR